MSNTLTCKVQYLNDVDPFGACTKFPEPTRPLLFTFNVNIPLINQIAAVHRLLQAPHKVSTSTQAGGGGDLDVKVLLYLPVLMVFIN